MLMHLLVLTAAQLLAEPQASLAVLQTSRFGAPFLHLRGGMHTGAQGSEEEQRDCKRVKMQTLKGRVQKRRQISSSRLKSNDGGARVAGAGPEVENFVKLAATQCSDAGFTGTRLAQKPKVYEFEWRGSDGSEDASRVQDGADLDDKSDWRQEPESAETESCRKLDGEDGSVGDGGVIDEGDSETYGGATAGGEGGNRGDDDDDKTTWREHRWPLDLNGVLAMYNHLNETLMLEVGEYQLSSLVRIDETAHISYSPPETINASRLVNETVNKVVAEALASAETEIVQESDDKQTGSTFLQQRMVASEGIVVRLWGAWSMGA